MNMKFLTEFRNKIVAGGRKGGLSKSPKKSAWTTPKMGGTPRKIDFEAV